MTYNSGQFLEVVYALPKDPKWLVLGGPADGDEAQTAVKQFPSLRVVGCEPNLDAIAWQVRNGWPYGAPILQAAMHSSVGRGLITDLKVDLRHASMDPLRGGYLAEVDTTTVDALSELYGPFEDAILWLDIEGVELEALLGAEQCFREQRFILANVEFMARNWQKNLRIEQFFARHGFHLEYTWNVQPGLVEDRVYVHTETQRRDKLEYQDLRRLPV